jgi:drug/metabolite transporter (DMT)-like permease
MVYLFLIITTSLWGSLYIVQKIALADIPPVTMAMLRYIVATLTFSILLLIKRKKITFLKEDRGTIFFIGVVGYFISICAQIMGTRYGSASLASLINSLNPVFISVFAALYLKERAGVIRIFSILLALAGVYCIVAGDHGAGLKLGVIFSFISVTLWSMSSVAVKKIAGKYDPFVITAAGIWIATLLSIPASILELSHTEHYDLFSVRSILCILYLGSIGTALPHLLWNVSLSRLDAGICSLFYPVQPIVSALLGALILHEKMGLSFFAGAALVISGLLISIICGSVKKKDDTVKISGKR